MPVCPITLTELTVVQHFGVNPAAYARFGLPGHDGVDLFAFEGTQLYAPVDGVISGLFNDPGGWGLNLSVDADDGAERWFLCHLRDYGASQVGDHVVAGTPICTLGRTGNTDGKHVHVTLLPNRSYGSGPYHGRVDPLPRLLLLAK